MSKRTRAKHFPTVLLPAPGIPIRIGFLSPNLETLRGRLSEDTMCYSRMASAISETARA